MLRIFCMTKTRVTLDIGDAAENDDHQADEAQVVLRRDRNRARLRPSSSGTSARANELFFEVERRRRGLTAGSSPPARVTSRTRRARLPTASRPVDGRSSLVDQHARSRLNPPTRRPGSVVITPRIVKRACPRATWSPTADPAPSSSSGRTSAPWFCSKRVGISLPPTKDDRCRRAENPVERRAARPCGPLLCRQPGATWSASRSIPSVRARRYSARRRSIVCRRLRRPIGVRGDQHVRRDQRLRLAPEDASRIS